jgi:endonuclease YncB( thermonuclease family)
MQVYLNRGGQQLGPYGIEQLRQYLDAGQLSPQDHACHDGATWIPLGEVPGLAAESPVPARSKKKIFWIAGGALTLAAALATGAMLLFGGSEEPKAVSEGSSYPQIFVLTAGDVVSVYDGDTFKVDLQGVHPLFGNNVSIRVNGIDTPEITGQSDAVEALGQQARELAKSMLESAAAIELRNPQRGKYFRILADVYVDGESLAAKLKLAGLAKTYDGKGPKPNWEAGDN